MATKALIPVAEYLGTTYHPDCDYVDGELVERNVGTFDHSRAQTKLAARLVALEEKLGILVVTEQRVQVKSERFRIPDLAVVRADHQPDQVFRRAPFLCIEILSPDDRASEMQERIDDFLAMGVPFVWLIDPRTRRGWVYTTESAKEAKDGVMRTSGDPVIEVPLSELFD